ncbi:AbrB/MazE/SpoVT family DNA-binding domain-containing protein [Nanoarchaeota archaeon]
MPLKKFPKLVQCDSRGQIVIPKDIRQELSIDEGTGMWMFSISDEGILLKLVEKPNLDDSAAMSETREKAGKLDINPKNLKKTKQKYKPEDKLEEI